jgi:hypothetical protein
LVAPLKDLDQPPHVVVQGAQFVADLLQVAGWRDRCVLTGLFNG